jgi:ubiquitin-like protein Pup
MTQVHEHRRGQHDEPKEVGAIPKPDTEKAEKLRHDLDEVLDEIDEVLEENAEEFVRSFVQKGGQ